MTTEVEEIRDGRDGRQGKWAEMVADSHGGGDVVQREQRQ